MKYNAWFGFPPITPSDCSNVKQVCKWRIHHTNNTNNYGGLHNTNKISGYQVTQLHLYYPHTVTLVLSTHSYTCITHTQLHLYYPHTVTLVLPTYSYTCITHIQLHLYYPHTSPQTAHILALRPDNESNIIRQTIHQLLPPTSDQHCNVLQQRYSEYAG